MDSEGITPAGLELAIQQSRETTRTAPRLLYVVPHCQNPSGATMSPSRKQQIYSICQHHNIIIIEDDPYFYLQFPATGDDMPGVNVEPGFLSLDTDGRVIRIDSFSKIIGPGFRLAWVTATASVTSHILNTSYMVSFGASSFSQAIAYELLSSWGLEGFEAFLKQTQAFYKRQSSALVEALREHCGDLIVARQPAGSMFLWVEFPCVEDAEDLLDHMVTHKVVMVPGRYFSPRSNDTSFKCKFARLSYSSLTTDQLQEAARRIRLVVDSYLQAR